MKPFHQIVQHNGQKSRRGGVATEEKLADVEQNHPFGRTFEKEVHLMRPHFLENVQIDLRESVTKPIHSIVLFIDSRIGIE